MTRQRREQIIAVSARISQLREEVRAKESELRRLEADLDALFNQSDESPASSAPLTQRGGIQQSEFTGARSLADHIIEILDAEPGREIEAEDMLPRIQGAKVTSLRSALARLATQGKIVRGARGKYKSAIMPPAQPELTEEVKE